MKTEQSYRVQLAKLRAEHTAAFRSREFPKMQSIGSKIVGVLDALTLHFPDWKETPQPRSDCECCQGRGIIIPMGYQGEAVNCPLCGG